MFRDGELEVLKYLGWRLRAFPSLHIIGYFLAKGVTFQDDSWQNRPLIEKITKYVKNPDTEEDVSVTDLETISDVTIGEIKNTETEPVDVINDIEIVFWMA